MTGEANDRTAASPLLYDGATVYTPGISERRVGGATSFYLLDSVGSVVPTTNGSQYQASDQRFDAFGNRSAYSGFGSTFGFAAKAQYRTDAESGLMLLGHRYYDPSVGLRKVLEGVTTPDEVMRVVFTAGH